MSNPIVKGFWDKPTGSWQYVLHDPDTMKGAIIDPVLDFDPLAGATSTKNAERLLAYVREAGIGLVWILDHLPTKCHRMQFTRLNPPYLPCKHHGAPEPEKPPDNLEFESDALSGEMGLQP